VCGAWSRRHLDVVWMAGGRIYVGVTGRSGTEMSKSVRSDETRPIVLQQWCFDTVVVQVSSLFFASFRVLPSNRE
jgi:hypothetical protein